jgi:hypothetical protein
MKGKQVSSDLRGSLMNRKNIQSIENKAVNRAPPKPRKGAKKGWQNEGITLWFVENKEDKK